MGTLVRLPQKQNAVDKLSATEKKVLHALREMHLRRIAEASHTCDTLYESAEILRRSIRQLVSVTEMIEDAETRDELRAMLHTAGAKLAASFVTCERGKRSAEIGE